MQNRRLPELKRREKLKLKVALIQFSGNESNILNKLKTKDESLIELE